MVGTGCRSAVGGKSFISPRLATSNGWLKLWQYKKVRKIAWYKFGPGDPIGFFKLDCWDW